MAKLDCESRQLDTLRTSDIENHDLFVFATAGSEPRGRLAVWDELAARWPMRCVEVLEQESDSIRILRAGSTSEVSLRDGDSLAALMPDGTSACIDISGLAHQVWAPLVKVSAFRGISTTFLYTEPAKYRQHASPAYPDLFDLSESFGGYAPIPGFARLSDPPDSQAKAFVALLGFEGMRPTRLALELDPEPKVVAIVGVPGFRAEYPTVTVACNVDFLDTYRAHNEVRFSAAHCPCETYEQLVKLHQDFPDHFLYLAPVGTKPHALGAVCYAIMHPLHSELMYDHPKRRPRRTEGIGPVHLYSLKLVP